MTQASLKICLFGSHLLRCGGGRPVSLGLRGTTLNLLRYLILHAGRELRRECIADQFWRDSSEARQKSALNSAIWRISKKLPAESGLSLNVDGTTISLEIARNIVVDARLLTELVQKGSEPAHLDQPLVDRLSVVINETDAPFMEGLVEDWVLSERERLFNIRMRGLTLLLHWHGDGRRYEDALEIGRRLLLADPFREIVQIDMMWLYVLSGQRARAIMHYQTYASLLERELSIEPMPETKALYDHIRRDLSASQSLPLSASDRTPDSSAPKQKLDAMLMIIEQSRRELYQVLRAQLG